MQNRLNMILTCLLWLLCRNNIHRFVYIVVLYHSEFISTLFSPRLLLPLFSLKPFPNLFCLYIPSTYFFHLFFVPPKLFLQKKSIKFEILKFRVFFAGVAACLCGPPRIMIMVKSRLDLMYSVKIPEQFGIFRKNSLECGLASHA